MSIEVGWSDRHTYCHVIASSPSIELAVGSVSCVFTPISVDPWLLTIRWGSGTLSPPLGKPRARIIWRGHGREKVFVGAFYYTWHVTRDAQLNIRIRRLCTTLRSGPWPQWSLRCHSCRDYSPLLLPPHCPALLAVFKAESLLVLPPGVSLGVLYSFS